MIVTDVLVLQLAAKEHVGRRSTQALALAPF